MSKSKSSQKNNTVQQVSNVHVDIDYDKLAKAIVSAQTELNEKNSKEPETRVGFWKSIYLIMLGKKATQDKLTVGLLSIPLVALFRIISVIGFISAITILLSTSKQALHAEWIEYEIIKNNLTMIIGYFLFALITVLFSIIIWGASNEIKKSEDKNYVTAVFSGIVSLVALIVSFVALKR